MGGNANAVARLDNYFTQLNAGPGSQYAFMGNEPCEGDPWEYDFAGAPAKTQDTVRRIQSQLFTNTPNGFLAMTMPALSRHGMCSRRLVFIRRFRAWRLCAGQPAFS